MTNLEETSVKVNVLREEYDKRNNEVLTELIGSMLGHAKVGETFEEWYAGWHSDFMTIILEEFTGILSGKNISSPFVKEDLGNMYIRIQKGLGRG
jgi:hypothetical protein